MIILINSAAMEAVRIKRICYYGIHHIVEEISVKRKIPEKLILAQIVKLFPEFKGIFILSKDYQDTHL
jgi:hypothetical protein